MITVHSILEEFNARIESPDYVETVHAHPLPMEDFERIDEGEQMRAAMILSALINYGFEPHHYYYDSSDHELLLEYPNQDFVAVLSLVNVGFSG